MRMKFNKHNHSRHPDALQQEAHGLQLLAEQLQRLNSPIKIPVVYAVDQHTLTLNHINQKTPLSSQWHTLGQTLAELHQVPQKHYGHDTNNYIGLNPQANAISDNWGEFFYLYRLTYQVDLIQDPNTSQQFNSSLFALREPLIEFLNQNCPHPSLLHGDLWSGNVLFDATDVWLIDPAVYCGDAEADLAMTELFGGFPSSFYQAYTTQRPLSADYEIKKTIYNLYHQLNHYNLFGSGYLRCCKEALTSITRFF